MHLTNHAGQVLGRRSERGSLRAKDRLLKLCRGIVLAEFSGGFAPACTLI